MKLIQDATDGVNEDDVPLFHELGEGVDPKDLDMTQAIAASSGNTSKKRGVRKGGGARGCGSGHCHVGGWGDETSKV